MTFKSGIDKLCFGAKIDEAAFTPCGYSMNAIIGSAYFTAHITPEEGCSYVSFETNIQLTSYNTYVESVIATFRPKRFVMTFIHEKIHGLEHSPMDMVEVAIPMYGKYHRRSKSKVESSKVLDCEMNCYHCDDDLTLRQSLQEDNGIVAGARFNLNVPKTLKSGMDHHGHHSLASESFDIDLDISSPNHTIASDIC
jgi:hypothetical protein